MRSNLRAVSVLVVAFLFVVFACRATPAQETVPGWHSHLEQAQKVAEETGKPLFIVFRCVR